MSKSSTNVKRWRKETKGRMVSAMGGQCQSCGYKKCHAALEMHHLDPTEKDFSFGKIIASPKAWPVIVAELRKCVLVCSNCHREIHAEILAVPESRAVFNESYAVYRSERKPRAKKPPYDRHAPKLANRKVEWPSKEDLSKIVWTESLLNAGRRFGVTDNAIRRWCKTYGIALPPQGYHTRRLAGYTHEESLVSQKHVSQPTNWMTQDVAARASTLRKEGLSYRKIGKALGFGHWTIQQGLRRYGFEPDTKMAAQDGAAPSCP